MSATARDRALTFADELGLEVVEELRRAIAKHKRFNSAHEGYAVILEELDELWDEVRAWQPGQDFSKMRKEALQVAAMGLRFLYDLCPNKPSAEPPRCQDCAYAYMEPDSDLVCGHEQAGVVGTFTNRARQPEGFCGPDARLFRARALRGAEGGEGTGCTTR